MEAESAKNHNQQNEIPKDYSLLRKFDLEAAKRGELLTSINNTQYEYILKSWNTALVDGKEVVEFIVIKTVDYCHLYDFKVQEFDILRMLPLCWLEGKPVYKGDVLWRKDKHSAEVTKVVVTVVDDVICLDFGDERCSLKYEHHFSTLHWEKPKVKVQKEGWMNIYPPYENDGAFACVSGGVFITKELADYNAFGNRIDCVKVHWEVEE